MRKKLLTAAAGYFFGKLRIKPVYAWSGDVHRHITAKALELLEKEKMLSPAEFYKNWRTQLLEGSVQPDRVGDIDKGSGMHYYSCKNADGRDLEKTNGFYRNRLGAFLPSARTLFRGNYTGAVSLYKSGSAQRAMICLGRAIHFVSDMGCTPHTANMKVGVKPSNVHHTFEKQAGSRHSYTAGSFDVLLGKYYEKADPGEAFESLIKYSAKFAESITSLDPKTLDDAVRQTIPLTVQHAAAVLVRFYEDCSADNGNFLLAEKQYRFTNEGTGLGLTTTPKGLTVRRPDKGEDRKLTVKLGELGTFGLRITDGGYVRSDLKGFERPKKDGRATQFRAEALGSHRFIITTEDSGYKRVLAVKGGRLVSAAYMPEDPSMIWIVK